METNVNVCLNKILRYRTIYGDAIGNIKAVWSACYPSLAKEKSRPYSTILQLFYS